MSSNPNARANLKTILLVIAVVCLFLEALSYPIPVFHAGWLGMALWLLSNML